MLNCYLAIIPKPFSLKPIPFQHLRLTALKQTVLVDTFRDIVHNRNSRFSVVSFVAGPSNNAVSLKTCLKTRGDDDPSRKY